MKYHRSEKYLEDPILRTDASNYGISGYMYMVANGLVRVIRYFHKKKVMLSWYFPKLVLPKHLVVFVEDAEA